MQETIERWLAYYIAKPIAWMIYWLWLAIKYGWVVGVWCTSRLGAFWTRWRAKRAGRDWPAPVADVPFIPPTRRLSKREAARKL